MREQSVAGGCLLCRVLKRVDAVRGLDLHGWELLVRQARHSNLLPRLYGLLDQAGLLQEVPAPARAHLEASWTLALQHANDVRWEVRQVLEALAPLGFPVVLLKGTAYLMAGLPAARGRLFTDVDILVPREELARVERALFYKGWHTTHLDAYDQRYYRQWMHELPPLRHKKRQTVLDVHHTILPPTARLKPDPAGLLAAAVALPEDPSLRTLGPEDMVLHSATHLFHDGDLDGGLRDLVDLDALMRHFGADGTFWPALVERAREMDLQRPLYYATRHAARILETPVPPDVLHGVAATGPGWLLRPLMDKLMDRALAPSHPSCEDALTRIARWLLFVRSHYLRMPLYLLVPHLARKVVRTWTGAGDQ